MIGRKKTGGRLKGSKNKTTLEREAAAAVDAARGQQRELAKDVLERLMKVAEGATSLNKPTTQAELARGVAANPDGDWERFGAWFDRTAYCAKELAKYQSPQIKAVDAPAPPPDPGQLERDGRRVFHLRVFEGGRPLEEP